MRTRTKLGAWAVILLMVIAIGFSTIPPAKAQFVMAEWDYPDEYGQGIFGFFFEENSTGTFLPVAGPIIDPDNDTVFEFDAGISLGMDIRITINYTLLGLDFPSEVTLGLNYFRLNVTVTSASVIVFFQANCTYDYLNGAVETDIWYYAQDVYFDFLNMSGTIYIITVTYEVFY